MFIRVECRLEADEFARGILAAFRRGHRIFQAVGVLVVLLEVAAFAISSAKHQPRPSSWATTLVLAVGFYAILLPWIRAAVLKRQYRQRQVKSMSVVLAEEGVTWEVETVGGQHRSAVAWSGFVRIRETPEFFLFYPSRKRANVVPKRAFAPDDADLLSRFVEHEFARARQTQPDVPAAQA
jgi:hypothetical protein